VISRRRIVLVLGAGALGPLTSVAQQSAKIPRIGYLARARGRVVHQAFKQGLTDLGYIEGKNIFVEYRFSGARDELLPDLAAELARLKVDVIVAPSPPTLTAAMKATNIIPIVTRWSTDPVASGVIASFGHPGGNLTGVFTQYSELNGKRLQILKEAIPDVSRVMLLASKNRGAAKPLLLSVAQSAHSLGLIPLAQEVDAPAELPAAFLAAARDRANGLLVLRSPMIVFNRAQIAKLATQAHLPAIYDDATYADAGGLLSYGANLSDEYRRLAAYVDKILKGARPGDLPVEQPTTFELVINLKTAKALGITIPQSLLLRADRVIE